MEATDRASYEAVVVPHLDAAYRFARWLMRNDHDAEDAVQEAALRAIRYFSTFAGGNGRAWFFRIVRNTCNGWRDRQRRMSTDPFDEEQHGDGLLAPTPSPETLLLQRDDAESIERAMTSLPTHLREVLVLRELEDLSYRELADVIGTPIGTVMSRLSRARSAMRAALEGQQNGPDTAAGAFAGGRGGAGAGVILR